MLKSFLSPLNLPFPKDESENRLSLYTILALIVGMAGAAVLSYLIYQQQALLALLLLGVVPGLVAIIRYPLISVLAWLLLLPFLPTNVVPGSVFWVIHRAIIPLALIIQIILNRVKGKPLFPAYFGWPELSMATYLAVAAVSAINAHAYPLQSLYTLYDRAFVPFAAYALIRLANLRKRDLNRMLIILVFIGFAEVLIGLWATYFPQTLPSLWTFARMGNRMSGTYNGPTAYTYTLLLGMLFVWYAAMHKVKGGARAALLLLFSIGLVCVFLTYTRTCWVTVLFILLGLAFLYPQYVLPLVLIFAVLGMGLSTNVLSSHFERALERITTTETVHSRLVLDHAGMSMFFARPAFGWGYEAYDLNDWKFMELVGESFPTRWDLTKGTSHNTLITFLAETGVVGFALYFFPFAFWFFLSLRALPRLRQPGFSNWRFLVIVWFSIVAYFLLGQTVDMRYFRFPLGALWITLGVIAAILQNTHVKSERSEAA